MEENDALVSETKTVDLSLPEYLSVHEAATIMGLSGRSVYGYIEQGKLAVTKTETVMMVRREDVIAFQRRGPGKTRTHTPCWRLPPEPNALSLTILTVRVCPGQRKTFTERLADMYQEKAHPFPGTSARYIVSNQRDPDEITIILVWRLANSSVQTRRDALAAWMADFADVLDWNTAHVQDGKGLLYA